MLDWLPLRIKLTLGPDLGMKVRDDIPLKPSHEYSDKDTLLAVYDSSVLSRRRVC